MKKMRPRELLKQFVIDALAAAPTIAPRCPHFGECGGCEYQNYAYEDQCAAKLSAWNKLLSAAKLSAEFPTATITPSPLEYHYRQRMDYVFAFDAAGLRRARSHRHVINLTACPLLGERGWAAFQRAKELAIIGNLPSYDYLRHVGFLRYFVIRQTRTGGVMAALVTKRREYEEEITAIAECLIAEKFADSVYWLLQETLADTSFGEPLKNWGEENLTENYLGMDFSIGVNTFAQANAEVAAEAYRAMQERHRDEPFLADIFAGSGVIGALLSAQCGHVVAVENNADNLALATRHYERHHLENITLIADDAGKFLRQEAALAERHGAGDFSAVVVNPPRAGLGVASTSALVEIAPPRITYMSCNPLSLLDDAKILLPRYAVESVRLFDMFPQTHHWETLVFLRRK